MTGYFTIHVLRTLFSRIFGSHISVNRPPIAFKLGILTLYIFIDVSC